MNMATDPDFYIVKQKIVRKKLQVTRYCFLWLYFFYGFIFKSLFLTYYF